MLRLAEIKLAQRIRVQTNLGLVLPPLAPPTSFIPSHGQVCNIWADSSAAPPAQLHQTFHTQTVVPDSKVAEKGKVLGEN